MERRLDEMKIAWFLEGFPNPYQIYIANLLNNLRKIYGLNITVVTYQFDGVVDAKFPVKIVRFQNIFDKAKNFIFGNRLNSAEKILQNFDIVHVQHSFLYPFISSLSRNKGRSKYVITFRGGDSYIKPWINETWRVYHERISSDFDAIQVMSQNQKEYLLKWGHTTDKTHVIPISTSTLNSKLINNSIGEKIEIFSVFRMTWEKNIEANLRLVKALKKEGVSLSYNVFGDGVDLGQLYYLVDRFGLNDIVKIHGRVTPEVLSSEISKNNILLQLSSSEALPASVIEALSFGVPCIVSDVGGLPEIIQNDYNGHVMDFDEYNFQPTVNFFKRILHDNTFYQKLKLNAITSYNTNFSPVVEAEKIYKMYKSLI